MSLVATLQQCPEALPSCRRATLGPGDTDAGNQETGSASGSVGGGGSITRRVTWG